MLMKVLPVVFLLVGSGAGVGAGIFLRPSAPDPGPDMMATTAEASVANTALEGEETTLETIDYVRMSNQFVVPVVAQQRVASLVVMSISIEVPQESRDMVFRHEPKLRDSFLQVLFDHANAGGFSGAFTSTSNLDDLRTALTETGQRDIGADIVKDVLITEIARQDY